MIKTIISRNGSIILMNPYTISYMYKSIDGYSTTIGFTNGKEIDVTAGILELKEAINDETKSLCKECMQDVQD